MIYIYIHKKNYSKIGYSTKKKGFSMYKNTVVLGHCYKLRGFIMPLIFCNYMVSCQFISLSISHKNRINQQNKTLCIVSLVMNYRSNLPIP